MKLKMSKEQEQLFEHLGEVAVVYDGKHKRLWSPPHVEEIMEGKEHGHVPGIRVWVSIDSDKGDYAGDYIFILRSFGAGPEGIYTKYKEEVNEALIDEAKQIIWITIIEDVTVWGQAATEEPYQEISEKITDAGRSNKIWIRFSPDCGICKDIDGLSYST